MTTLRKRSAQPVLLPSHRTGFVVNLKTLVSVYAFAVFVFMAVFDDGPLYGIQLAFRKYSPG